RTIPCAQRVVDLARGLYAAAVEHHEAFAGAHGSDVANDAPGYDVDHVVGDRHRLAVADSIGPGRAAVRSPARISEFTHVVGHCGSPSSSAPVVSPLVVRPGDAP